VTSISLYPVRNNASLGFEPFDGAHGPEYVEGSQHLEFLTGFSWSGFYNLERKLAIVVLERPDGYVHPHLYIFRLNLFCYPGEQL
jgi:hypothetical protein